MKSVEIKKCYTENEEATYKKYLKKNYTKELQKEKETQNNGAGVDDTLSFHDFPAWSYSTQKD